MKRFFTILVASAFILICVTFTAFAAGPSVSKSVLASDDETAVIVIRVAASGTDIYAITIKDESGSVDDIVSPSGWCGLSAGDYVSFVTVDKPIKAGSSKSFRIITKNQDASLSISFRDKDSPIGAKKTI